MSRSFAHLCVLAGFPLFFVGCISGPSVWTSETTSELSIDSAELTKLEAVTYNGDVNYQGAATAPAELNIKVIKRGGGVTLKDAQDALEAVDVYVEDIGDGGKRVAWRWKEPRDRRWGAEVKFIINGAASLPIDLETHNGRIVVAHHKADADLESYNGRIEVESEGGVLRVETHNGSIVAESSASDWELTSYNGHIEADMRRSRSVGGKIATYNGSITLKLARDAACDIECETFNGSINFEMPVMLEKVSRGHMNARLGQGGSRLDVETYNGSITVKNAG